MKRLIMWALVFILIFSIAASQEPDIPPEQQIDYSNPQLDLNNPNLDLNLVDWSVRNQADVPASRIHELRPEIIKIEEISDRTQITVEQWNYGSNLNKAEDLSQYPNARQAVNQRHPGFTINLESGHTSYTDGILQNGNAPAIDLNDQNLRGTIISALTEGGFQIQRGTSSGEFTINNIEFNLGNDASTTAEVKPNGEIILSRGARMTDSEGTEIIAVRDATTVITRQNELSISGVALVRDKFGNYQRVGDFDLGSAGQFSLDYGENGYTLEQAALLLRNGRLRLSENANVEGDVLVFLDQRQLDSLAGTVVGALRETLTETCDFQGRCSYAAQDVSVRDVVGAMAQRYGHDPQFYEEQLDIPFEFAATLGVGAMVAAQALPSQVRFQTEDGEFRSVLGYNGQTFNPYLVAGLYDDELRVDVLPGGAVSSRVQVPFREEGSVSVTAVVSPQAGGQLERVGTQLALGEEGSLSISYGAGEEQSGSVRGKEGSLSLPYGAGEEQSGSVSYHRQIGPVASSLGVHGSERMQNVMLNLDFSRVFE